MEKLYLSNTDKNKEPKKVLFFIFFVDKVDYVCYNIINR